MERGVKSNESAEKAPYLLVAGIRDESSLGWSAAKAWLDANPDNQVVATIRSDSARDFVETQSEINDGRIDYVPVEWSNPLAYDELGTELKKRFGDDRQFAGFVHAIAGANRSSFKELAHDLDPKIYTDAIMVSSISLLQGIKAARDLLKPNAGIVTFGFGKPGTYVDGYGGVMSVAKSALSQLSIELAVSLGSAEPNARMLEIVTGYIPTRSGRGVALAQKIKPGEIASRVSDASPLAGTNHDLQRIAAGKMAVAFMVDPIFAQTTGETIHIDGGVSLLGLSPFSDSKKPKDK